MPTRDASSPARVTTVSAADEKSDSGTTAAFSPPSDSWLYLSIGSNIASGGTTTYNLPINTGTPLTWSVIGSGSNASGGGSGVYRAYNAVAQVAITVSVTISYSQISGTHGANSAAFWVDVWTGCNIVQVGAAATFSTTTAKTNNQAVTTTQSGSRVAQVGLDWSAGGNPTSSDTIDPYTVAGQTSGARVYKSTDSGGAGSVSVNFVCAGASGTNSFVTYEIISSGGAAAQGQNGLLLGGYRNTALGALN